MHYERTFTIGYREIRDRNRTFVLKTHWKGILGLALVAALIAFLYLPENLRQSSAATWGICALAGVIALPILGLLDIFRCDRTTKKAVRKQREQSYEQKIALDAFGVHVTVNKKTADAGYDKIVRVEETNKAFYVYITEKDGWILPKTQMKDPAAESAALREIFTTFLMSKDLKLKKN